MTSSSPLLLAIACLRLAAAEPSDLLDDATPVSVAPPPVPQVIIYKDVRNLPADAVRALEAFNTAEARARAAYEKQVDAERARLQKAVESAKVASTKAGNLEGALALKALSGRLTEVAADAVVAALVEGKWNYCISRSDGTVANHPIAFDKDGRIIAARGRRETSYKIVNGRLVFYTADKSVWVTFIRSDTGWDQAPDTVSGNGHVYKLTPVLP